MNSVSELCGKGGGGSLDMLCILYVSRPLIFLMVSEKFRRWENVPQMQEKTLKLAAAAEITQVS